MRRAIGAGGGHVSGAEELELQELLGEGSFGKVFKGTARGGSPGRREARQAARANGAYQFTALHRDCMGPCWLRGSLPMGWHTTTHHRLW